MAPRPNRARSSSFAASGSRISRRRGTSFLGRCLRLRPAKSRNSCSASALKLSHEPRQTFTTRGPSPVVRALVPSAVMSRGSVPLELEDFVLDAEFLSLQIGDRVLVWQGTLILLINGAF